MVRLLSSLLACARIYVCLQPSFAWNTFGSSAQGRSLPKWARPPSPLHAANIVAFALPPRSSGDVDKKEEPAASSLTPGIADGFFISKQYNVPAHDFDLSSVASSQCDRSQLRANNVTLPVALMLLDPSTYPSFSKAKKACRQGRIVLQKQSASERTRGRVGDRVSPSDVIYHQDRLSHGSYSSRISINPSNKPPFDLPVVYEDDYLAIVNKPAGIVVHRDQTTKSGQKTIKFALPSVLQAPPLLLEDRLEQPQICHRLDKATSGLLVCAKTKTALSGMNDHFAERRVKKTYTAILNGKPHVPSSNTISSLEAFEMGVEVDPTRLDLMWNVAASEIDSKAALTVWRLLSSQHSLHAAQNVVTVVELKPKTGRKHQLHRHMALEYGCPIVGDPLYGGKEIADLSRWGRGLLLCSNRVAFPQPILSGNGENHWVQASIEVPAKFAKFLAGEERKYSYLKSP